MGPEGFVYNCRKTWLWFQPDDLYYRNECKRYDCGTGPEIFKLAGLRATCFICADGEAPRCIERARLLKPEIVFYPNNREKLYLGNSSSFLERAEMINAPMLTSNRIGKSWGYDCKGGCTVISSSGIVLAQTGFTAQEDMLLYDLSI